MAETNNTNPTPVKKVNKQKFVYNGSHPLYKGELRLEVGGEYELDNDDPVVRKLLKQSLLTYKK